MKPHIQRRLQKQGRSLVCGPLATIALHDTAPEDWTSLSLARRCTESKQGAGLAATIMRAGVANSQFCGWGGDGFSSHHKVSEDVFVEHFPCRVAVTNLIKVLCRVPAGAVQYDIVACASAACLINMPVQRLELRGGRH